MATQSLAVQLRAKRSKLMVLEVEKVATAELRSFSGAPSTTRVISDGNRRAAPRAKSTVAAKSPIGCRQAAISRRPDAVQRSAVDAVGTGPNRSGTRA